MRSSPVPLTEVAAWRDGLLDVLRRHRDAYFGAYLRCARYVVDRGFCATMSNLASDAGDYYFLRYRELDAAIERIEAAPWRALEKYYCLVRQAEAA